MSEIQIIRNPEASELESLGVEDWPVWSCEVSRFPWTYEERETCYILEGRVTVTPEGGDPVTIGAGDLVTFPAGLSCTWDVHEPIRKHYCFG